MKHFETSHPNDTVMTIMFMSYMTSNFPDTLSWSQNKMSFDLSFVEEKTI